MQRGIFFVLCFIGGLLAIGSGIFLLFQSGIFDYGVRVVNTPTGQSALMTVQVNWIVVIYEVFLLGSGLLLMIVAGILGWCSHWE